MGAKLFIVNGETKRHSIDRASVPNIFDIKYTPTVLMKYPKIHDATNEPFPSYAAMVRQNQKIKPY